MPKRWVPQKVDDKRKEFVIREIREGSSPEPRFYFMVVISTLIAANGLVAEEGYQAYKNSIQEPLMENQQAILNRSSRQDP